ncbi:hypothetical protein HMPREF9969_0222 [Prevotella sp. oral taxon 306 str. F0472]|nr:hypothetical protein HMPREF9969_0222 [Prevotella sp. oral taxon 306 str. F0472]
MLYQQSKETAPETPPNLPQGERRSLSPAPSPNGEGSENHCLQIKGAFL